MAANIFAVARVVRTRGPKHERAKAYSNSRVDQQSIPIASLQLNLTILTDEFHQRRLQNHPRSARCHYGVSLKMIEAFFAYVCSGGYYRQVARSEGISKSTMILYCRKVSSFISPTAYISSYSSPFGWRNSENAFKTHWRTPSYCACGWLFTEDPKTWPRT